MRRTRLWLELSSVLFAAVLLACGDDTETNPPPEDEPTRFILDLSADLSDPAKFYDVPYPSDLRVGSMGTPDLSGFPNPSAVTTVTGLVENAEQTRGFPVIAVSYLRFDQPLAPREPSEIISADKAAPLMLIDIDQASPEKGRLFPLIARTLEADPYTSENVLAIATRPGVVLRPATRYGVVATSALLDAEGKAVASNPVLDRLRAGGAQGEAELAAQELYAPLWQTLEEQDIDAAQVVAATVFTTASVVADLARLGDDVLAAHDVTIDDLAFDADELYPELCVLRGSVTLPQFQEGEPPFDTGGRFVFDDQGALVVQRTETAPVVVVIPRTTMPADGYPLILNVHGSGGFSIAMVRPVGDDGQPGPPIGPAFPHALKGIATAGMAMPVNPERLPGASEIAYININNFAAMRDLFRQGTLEARLYLEALTKLEIDPTLLAACTGAALPVGETMFRFDADKLVIMGQSMGGMYTNMIGATEPLLRAAVPTGAGGYWPYFVLETELEDGGFPVLLSLLLQTQAPLTHLHPGLGIAAAAALEPADPIVYMPHLARMPLPGHPARPIYEPAGRGDSYFPTQIYDAVALSYGHPQAGDEVWPEMQDALALIGLDGLLDFPVENNLTSENGSSYTGAILQFEADGPYDPHAIYSHRDDVKRQYSCFLDSFFKTGAATIVPLESDWAAPCP